MAKHQTEHDEAAEPAKRKGHPFLLGCLFGLIIGIALGWWFRPPESFPVDELREATERKFLETKDQSRDRLADFAEDLAGRLRDE